MKDWDLQAEFEDGIDMGKESERDRIIEIIKSIDCCETFCLDCQSGFDEDSDECFRCNEKNIEHRDMDITKEKLVSLIAEEAKR